MAPGQARLQVQLRRLGWCTFGSIAQAVEYGNIAPPQLQAVPEYKLCGATESYTYSRPNRVPRWQAGLSLTANLATLPPLCYFRRPCPVTDASSRTLLGGACNDGWRDGGRRSIHSFESYSHKCTVAMPTA